MKKNIKAIFLDIDNTLLDFDECVRRAMVEGFAKFGLKPYEDWMYPIFVKINNKVWEQLENKELTFEELLHTRWQQVFDAIGIDFDGYTFEKYFVDYIYHSAIPVAGAEEILQYLQGKYILCAASNGPYRQQCNRLTKANMLEYFDHIFISERLAAVKPTVAFAEKALAEMQKVGHNFAFEEIMVIGDSLSSDIALGKNCGMQTCLFNREGRIHEAQVDYEVTSLEALKNII